ncbi:alpha/beta fold hydrolase [Pseudonocardia broussonetiae]|uniref:Alpha/beta hydrolase n=1 Tax=Pseudonocardia broussonetiae TaxID=2736640 RepID=A0A6M6JQJ0_9PSEU|nr:alpha/beta fold hydrolase [Pseudonocardia broussonetiae]QJY49267.1 alpha/beta hydrolase [Pseudonocardia broussonetiae]
MPAVKESLALVARELAPVLGVGRRSARRHPVWTDPDPVDGRGLGVVVVPGFGGADASMAVLRGWLASRGYRPAGAGLGVNVGCSADLVDRLERRVAEHAAATGGPVVLLGHSRGGWIGRLVAVRRPDLVRGLVMMGTPVLNPLDTRGAVTVACRALMALSDLGLRGLLERDCVDGTCRAATEAGLTAPLEMPVVALYSRSDGLVGWRSCLAPGAEHVEVTCSHTAMVHDPALFTALAPRLAAWVPRPE